MLLFVAQAFVQLLVISAQSECMYLLLKQQQSSNMTLSLAEEDKLVMRLACQGNLCPWCILDARHGYLDEAHRRVAQLREQLTADSPPEAARILMHCTQWCEKICEQYDVEPHLLKSSAPRGSHTGARTESASGSADCPSSPPSPPRPRTVLAPS